MTNEEFLAEINHRKMDAYNIYKLYEELENRIIAEIINITQDEVIKNLEK